MKPRTLTARWNNTWFIPGVFLVIVALAAWGVRHVYGTAALLAGRPANDLELVFALAFVMLGWTTLLAFLDRPVRASAEQQAELDKLNLAVSVPVYNEDPALLRQCLLSLVGQSRKPDHIYVVDDGSTAVDYQHLRVWARRITKQYGIRLTWQRTENGGKRHAQGVTVAGTPDADIYLTVDSDGILDPEAIQEGLKPFADPKVQSVAGVVLVANNTKNVLTRLTDLWFIVGQLVDRSAMSTMSSVLVNSGVLAFYRADMIRQNLDAYLNETFFGRRVEFSDDSMLTMYALAEGKAVQQRTSFAFTAMPETVSHHLRQYLRWMRGAFIRTWWRFKYLPLNSYSYWSHLAAWIQMAVSTYIFVLLFVVRPVEAGYFTPTLLLIPVLIGYGQALQYFSIKRSDEPAWSHLLTYLLAPVATLWSFVVLRVVRWYAILTCTKTGWGTRKTVEVKLEAAS